MKRGYEPINQIVWHKEIEIKLKYQPKQNSILTFPPFVWYFYVLGKEGYCQAKNEAIAAAKKHINLFKALAK